MPQLTRPDGAVIHYEVYGDGFPLLLLAGGIGCSEIASWRRSSFDPIVHLGGAFKIVAMDQRHAGRSTGHASPFSYDEAVGDQIAVLDAVDAPKALVAGESFGCALAWRLINEVPDRLAAALCIRPVGVVAGVNSLSKFLSLFDATMRLARAEGIEAVVRAAQSPGSFESNPSAGPFVESVRRDSALRAELLAMPVDRYAGLVVRYRDGMWPSDSPLFSVSSAWLAKCPAHLLVLPEDDELHPEGLADFIVDTAPRSARLDAGCLAPSHMKTTARIVRDFLGQYVLAPA